MAWCLSPPDWREEGPMVWCLSPPDCREEGPMAWCLHLTGERRGQWPGVSVSPPDWRVEDLRIASWLSHATDFHLSPFT